MSSEQLADGVNPLDAELAATWDILKGYSGTNTDLGIARRFGGAAAAYSLRDIGAMNGRVVRVRRKNDSTEEDFSANQVQAGVLEDFCDNVLTVGTAVNGTGAFNNYTLTNVSNSGFSADNSGGGTGSAGFPYTFKNGDVMIVTYTVTNFSSTSGLSPQIRGVTATSNVTSVAFGGTTFTSNGTYTDTLTATNDGTHLMFADGNTGSYTISNFAVTSHKTDGFVAKLYDQSGNGDDMSQTDTGKQPLIVDAGVQVKLENGKPAFKGDGIDDHLEASYFYSAGEVTAMSTFSVVSNRTDTGQEEAIISAGYGLSTTYPGFSIQLDRNTNSNPFEMRTANASGENETSILEIAKDGDILGSTFFTKDSTQLVRATTEDGSFNTIEATSVGAYHPSATSGKLRIGAIRSFAVRQFFGFFISEAIVFKGLDLRDEGIEDEINQFYNIG